MSRGYFGIGIINGKFAENTGTLWRSAYQLGAAFIFTIGDRCPKQPSDTTKAYRHIPLFTFDDWDAFASFSPVGTQMIAVETMTGAAVSLINFSHPPRAIYLLGAEDDGIPQDVIADCDRTIFIPSVRTRSYNVAVAGSIVMYDRMVKAVE
jgi:tRNA G18 (ribose-2'-O)-methylase SpoU